VIFPHFIDGDDIRVREAARGLRLAVEPLDPLPPRRALEVGRHRQLLQGDAPAHDGIARLVDNVIAARDLPDDLIAAERVAGDQLFPKQPFYDRSNPALWGGIDGRRGRRGDGENPAVGRPVSLSPRLPVAPSRRLHPRLDRLDIQYYHRHVILTAIRDR